MIWVSGTYMSEWRAGGWWHQGTRLAKWGQTPAPDSRQQTSPGEEWLQGRVPRWPEGSASTKHSPQRERERSHHIWLPRHLTHFIVTTTLCERYWLPRVQTRVIWIQRGSLTPPRLPSLVTEESGWKRNSLQSPGMRSAECRGPWIVGKGRGRRRLVFRNGPSGLGFWLMNDKPLSPAKKNLQKCSSSFFKLCPVLRKKVFL